MGCRQNAEVFNQPACIRNCLLANGTMKTLCRDSGRGCTCACVYVFIIVYLCIYVCMYVCMYVCICI